MNTINCNYLSPNVQVQFKQTGINIKEDSAPGFTKIRQFDAKRNEKYNISLTNL